MNLELLKTAKNYLGATKVKRNIKTLHKVI